MASSLSQKGGKKVGWDFIVELIFGTLTESTSVVTNDTQRPQEYPHHQK